MPSPLSICPPELHARFYLRMFTARAATRRTVTADKVHSAAISALVRRVNGIASVGLNAIELVRDT